MTALPGAATKVNMDQGTDDPKQARTELADHVDKFNSMRGYLTGLFGTDGVPATARTGLGLGSLATLNTIASAQLDALAVTTAKLAADAVTTAKITNGNVTVAKLESSLQKISISGQIDDPSAKTYVVVLEASYAFDVETLDIKTSAGTITAALQINAVNITGISAVAASTTQATGTATANNSVAIGDQLALVFTSDSTSGDLYFTIEGTRT